jgi:phage baseplate assembly protein W
MAEIYSDINLDTPDITPKVLDLKAVKQSIKLILTTFDGTRLFRPDLDAGINDLLFELQDDLALFTFRSQLTEAIEENDPRVTITQLEIDKYPDQKRVDINIIFEVAGLDGQQSEVIPFIG